VLLRVLPLFSIFFLVYEYVCVSMSMYMWVCGLWLEFVIEGLVFLK
jgi:hypothetical protein